MEASPTRSLPAAMMPVDWTAGQRAQAPSTESDASPELRDAFDQFVGETFFSQFLGAMRKMNSKASYFHGGRAEEVFQAQLDQVLAEKMTDAGVRSIAEPMFELFNLRRR